MLYIIRESKYELRDKTGPRRIICDNPCGLCIGVPLHFWGLSSGIPWQKPCLHFNMPFLFRVGIDLSILPEPVRFFFIFCTSEFGASLVDSFWSSLFFSGMKLMELFFNWVCCFSWTLFFSKFQVMLILTLVDISQWELFYYGMKYRSWRRLIYLEVLTVHFRYFKSSSNIYRYESLRV